MLRFCHPSDLSQSTQLSSLLSMDSKIKTWYSQSHCHNSHENSLFWFLLHKAGISFRPSCYFGLWLSCTQNLIRSLTHLYFLNLYMKTHYGQKENYV